VLFCTCLNSAVPDVTRYTITATNQVNKMSCSNHGNKGKKSVDSMDDKHLRNNQIMKIKDIDANNTKHFFHSVTSSYNENALFY